MDIYTTTTIGDIMCYYYAHFLRHEVVKDVSPGRRRWVLRHVGQRRCRRSASALERGRCSKFLEWNTVLARRCSSLVLECSYGGAVISPNLRL